MKTGRIGLALGLAGLAALGAAPAQTQAAYGTLINGTKGLGNFYSGRKRQLAHIMEDGIGSTLGNGHLVTKEYLQGLQDRRRNLGR